MTSITKASVGDSIEEITFLFILTKSRTSSMKLSKLSCSDKGQVQTVSLEQSTVAREMIPVVKDFHIAFSVKCLQVAIKIVLFGADILSRIAELIMFSDSLVLNCGISLRYLSIGSFGASLAGILSICKEKF